MNYNNREIERKFTIKGYDYRTQAYEIRNIRQGLLNTHGKNEIRVTIRDQELLVRLDIWFLVEKA